jgi:hypothetical protein
MRACRPKAAIPLSATIGAYAAFCALYRRVGVDSSVVTGISSVDEKAIPASDCGPRKDARRSFLFFDTKQLRRLGIVIEDRKPSTDPAEADRRYRDAALGAPVFAPAVGNLPQAWFVASALCRNERGNPRLGEAGS